MTTLDVKDIQAMLVGAADAVLADIQVLTKLDSTIGDGDHGLAMQRAMNALKDAVTTHGNSNPRELLFQVSWGVMSIDGGSTGPLLGAFFMGMSEALTDDAILDSSRVLAMIEAGADNLCRQTQARVGDKTLMDALLPAVDALNTCSPEWDLNDCLASAAEAAEQGAERTAAMTARFGRARNLGERAVGHIDPGAMSMALMLRGFAVGLTQSAE